MLLIKIARTLAVGLLLLGTIRTQAASSYQASGVALHQCSCAYACPCMFENGPDNCALAAVYHFDKASYGGVDVSGLSMISIDGAVDAHAPKMISKMAACCVRTSKTAKNAKTNVPAGVIYLDAKATLPQRQALLGLMQAHGEWPGAGRPVRVVPIEFVKTNSGYKTHVPGLFDGETAGVLSRTGTPIVVSGVGFAEGPRWTVGRSVVNDLHDAALHLRWHLPNTNGSSTQFHWASH